MHLETRHRTTKTSSFICTPRCVVRRPWSVVREKVRHLPSLSQIDDDDAQLSFSSPETSRSRSSKTQTCPRSRSACRHTRTFATRININLTRPTTSPEERLHVDRVKPSFWWCFGRPSRRSFDAFSLPDGVQNLRFERVDVPTRDVGPILPLDEHVPAEVDDEHRRQRHGRRRRRRRE